VLRKPYRQQRIYANQLPSLAHAGAINLGKGKLYVEGFRPVVAIGAVAVRHKRFYLEYFLIVCPHIRLCGAAVVRWLFHMQDLS
jgi:hypothetical protein